MKRHISIILIGIFIFIQLYTADNPIDRTIALMFEKGKDTYTAIIVITDHQKPDKKNYLYMSDPQFIDKVTIKNEKIGIIHIKDSSFFNNIILTLMKIPPIEFNKQFSEYKPQKYQLIDTAVKPNTWQDYIYNLAMEETRKATAGKLPIWDESVELKRIAKKTEPTRAQQLVQKVLVLKKVSELAEPTLMKLETTIAKEAEIESKKIKPTLEIFFRKDPNNIENINIFLDFEQKENTKHIHLSNANQPDRITIKIAARKGLGDIKVKDPTFFNTISSIIHGILETEFHIHSTSDEQVTYIPNNINVRTGTWQETIYKLSQEEIDKAISGQLPPYNVPQSSIWAGIKGALSNLYKRAWGY